MNTPTMKCSNHGLNIRHVREGKRMKQETLAERIGISQSALSNYENKEQLDDEIIEKIANALEVPVEAITCATEDAPLNIFSGTQTNHENAAGNIYGCLNGYYPTFNPIDRVAELYERLLKSEQEKIALLEKTVEKLAGKK